MVVIGDLQKSHRSKGLEVRLKDWSVCLSEGLDQKKVAPSNWVTQGDFDKGAFGKGVGRRRENPKELKLTQQPHRQIFQINISKR